MIRGFNASGTSSTPNTGTVVTGRCPGCRKNGTFSVTPIVNDLFVAGRGTIGLRLCPDPSCSQLIGFVDGKSGRKLVPTALPPFDSADVPVEVAGAFDEALTCHANDCFVAAAMMVRKTLELLCADRGATGDTLQKRIANLSSVVVLPPPLLKGADALRLLGNDAAHFESREFEKIGRPELDLAIDFTRELLKAVYQYAGLVARFDALRNVSPKP